MIRKTAITIALGATLVAALTGCSSSSPDGGSSSQTARATATATAKPTPTQKPVETKYNKCIDGLATVDASTVKAGETFELGDCAHVAVLGTSQKGSTITLGAVDSLLVEGSKLTIEVGSAKSITVPGSGNTVHHGGDAKVTDLGKDNEVTAR